MNSTSLTERNVLAFYVPLALSGLMLSLARPTINAALARGGDVEVSLAAYAVAVSISFMFRGPVFSLRPVVITLSRNPQSFGLIRRFSLLLGGALTGLVLAIAWTPLYDLVVLRAMGIPEGIALAARPTLKILAFMPLMSSGRVFYQGILVRRHRPRGVGLGSIGQYTTLAVVLTAGVGCGLLRSSIVAAWATICGEVTNTAILVWGTRSTAPDRIPTDRLSVGSIWRFFWPLAVSMIMMTLFEPIVNAGIARTRDAVFALAAYPIYMSIIALIDWPVWNVQQVTMALVTDGPSYRLIRRFTLKLSLLFTVGLFLFNVTPLAEWVLTSVIGVHGQILRLARWGLWAMTIWPMLTGYRNFVQALLIRWKRTGDVRSCMVVRLGVLGLLMLVGAGFDGIEGVRLATVSSLIAATMEILLLHWYQVRHKPCHVPAVEAHTAD